MLRSGQTLGAQPKKPQKDCCSQSKNSKPSKKCGGRFINDQQIRLEAQNRSDVFATTVAHPRELMNESDQTFKHRPTLSSILGAWQTRITQFTQGLHRIESGCFPWPSFFPRSFNAYATFECQVSSPSNFKNHQKKSPPCWKGPFSSFHVYDCLLDFFNFYIFRS